MNNDQRTAVYLRDRTELTPRQSRRVRHKGNEAGSKRVLDGVPRHGRLRRRFDRKDNAHVRMMAARFVATFGRRRT